MLLVQGIYKHLAHPKPYPLLHAKTGSPTKNPSLYHFHCFTWIRPILHHSGGLSHALLPAKVAIYCKRGLGCHLLLGCIEEELGTTRSHWKQDGQNCGHYRHSGVGTAANSLDHRVRARK